MSDAPVNPESGRQGRRRQTLEQKQPHRGSRRLGFIGRYVQGAHIDPTSNFFDYGLFVAILVIALLIARSWHGSPIESSPQAPPPISSGMSGSSSPASGATAHVTSSISASGGGQAEPLTTGGGSSGPDTVLAAGRPDAGELDSDKPVPPSRRGRTLPKIIHKETAAYTNEARFARFNGKVIAVFTVDDEGTPQSIELTAPAPYGLGERAIAAVRKWRYQPATQDGKPVSARLVEEVPFR
jgi:TonB family protein